MGGNGTNGEHQLVNNHTHAQRWL